MCGGGGGAGMYPCCTLLTIYIYMTYGVSHLKKLAPQVRLAPQGPSRLLRLDTSCTSNNYDYICIYVCVHWQSLHVPWGARCHLKTQTSTKNEVYH